MTDYEAWLDNKRNDSMEMQYELSIHRCPKCNAIMRKEEENYGLCYPFKDVWYECPKCDYKEDC